jgi:hypothetical protein
VATELWWLGETRREVLCLIDHWNELNDVLSEYGGFHCWNAAPDFRERSPVTELRDLLYNENPVYHVLQTVSQPGVYEFPGIWVGHYDLDTFAQRVGTRIELATEWACALDGWLDSLGKHLKQFPELGQAFFSLGSVESSPDDLIFNRGDLDLPRTAPTAILLEPLRRFVEGYYSFPLAEFAEFPVAIQREWAQVEVACRQLFAKRPRPAAPIATAPPTRDDAADNSGGVCGSGQAAETNTPERMLKLKELRTMFSKDGSYLTKRRWSDILKKLGVPKERIGNADHYRISDVQPRLPSGFKREIEK